METGPWQRPDVMSLSHHMSASYERLTGRNLGGGTSWDDARSDLDIARDLYHHHEPLLCHDAADEPRFVYANMAAQHLWEMTWDDFIGLPSRLSAEPDERADRALMLARVAAQGFIDDYRGIRISSSGRRFLVERTTVWNVHDEVGNRIGQGAKIVQVTPLPPS